MRDVIGDALKSRSQTLIALLLAAGALLVAAPPAAAQPSADQLLTDMGLSGDDKQRVLNGEFVTAEVGAVSDRDLAFAIAFLVKTSPEALSKMIVAGELITSDAQVKAYGLINPPGKVEDFAKLQVSPKAAKALAGVKAGDAVNLSTSEITAFAPLAGGSQQAVQQQVQRMLFARYQAYRAGGLDGIAPYDRGGSTSDLAADLKKAGQAATGLKKYMPSFHAVLLDYPKATVPGMRENFYWARSDIQGKETYVLTHILVASDGPARAVVQRQYYASTGYNGQQAVAGFLPVQGGTVVVYAAHAFTDQVAGFGGSMKRGVGKRIMAEQMKKIFDAGRTKADK
ncbi:MAG TPA: hypothetical protein VEG33_01295 [Streptosporangiaceae bacterium]|nr:hypothetical protein [Streptosporangiaceae bacterium]